MSTQEPVISNSSPLIHLAKIDQLGLLPGCFGEVLIPRAVYDECVTEGRDRPEMAMIKQAAWLRVVEVENLDLVRLLRAEIDRGEAKAIALALEQRRSLLLLDDSDAREKARILRLRMTGTLGVLLWAKRAGKIASLSDQLKALRDTGFWLSRRLTDRLLLEAGEGS